MWGAMGVGGYGSRGVLWGMGACGRLYCWQGGSIENKEIAMADMDEYERWVGEVAGMSEGEFLKWKRGILEAEVQRWGRCSEGDGSLGGAAESCEQERVRLMGLVERCMEVRGVEEACVLCLRSLGELESSLRGLEWILRGCEGSAEAVFLKTVEVDVVWG